jgi:hypothetical protein
MNKALEEAARRAEQRKSEAIERLVNTLKAAEGLPSEARNAKEGR